MGREEAGNCVVVEGKASCAQPLGVGRQVDPASAYTGLKLGGPVASVAEPLQDRPQGRQEIEIDAGIGPEAAG